MKEVLPKRFFRLFDTKSGVIHVQDDWGHLEIRPIGRRKLEEKEHIYAEDIPCIQSAPFVSRP
jgi:hypothetical protein